MTAYKKIILLQIYFQNQFFKVTYNWSQFEPMKLKINFSKEKEIAKLTFMGIGV